MKRITLKTIGVVSLVGGATCAAIAVASASGALRVLAQSARPKEYIEVGTEPCDQQKPALG